MARASILLLGRFAALSNRLTSIDVATGERTVRKVASVAGCGPVVFAGIRKGSTIVFAAPVALDRRPTRLGAAHAYVASAVDGRVWLVGHDCDSPRMHGVREHRPGLPRPVELPFRLPRNTLAYVAG